MSCSVPCFRGRSLNFTTNLFLDFISILIRNPYIHYFPFYSLIPRFIISGVGTHIPGIPCVSTKGSHNWRLVVKLLTNILNTKRLHVPVSSNDSCASGQQWLFLASEQQWFTKLAGSNDINGLMTEKSCTASTSRCPIQSPRRVF